MRRYLLPMAMGVSVLVAGCKKEEPPSGKVTASDVEKKAAETAGAAADYARQEKDEYVARAQKAVDEAAAEIDRLKAKAGHARAGAKVRLERKIDAMEARWKRAERKLAELKSAGGTAWKDLKAGVDKAIEDLKRPEASRRAT